jgi:hypothetical protein
LESIIDIHFLEHVKQGQIINNFIGIFIDGGVTKVDVVLTSLSFGVNNVFVF